MKHRRTSIIVRTGGMKYTVVLRTIQQMHFFTHLAHKEFIEYVDAAEYREAWVVTLLQLMRQKCANALRISVQDTAHEPAEHAASVNTMKPAPLNA
ncbi:hypothetical protein DL765_003202 [Monosporascus sp. GIB2]|nr:hypothetical protein DL765_003202 [Monosporascus sp. GIB2]